MYTDANGTNESMYAQYSIAGESKAKCSTSRQFIELGKDLIAYRIYNLQQCQNCTDDLSAPNKLSWLVTCL